MAPQIDLFFSLVFLAGVLGILVALILLFVHKASALGPRLLAGCLVCFSVLSLNYALMTLNFFSSYPGFWRLLAWGSVGFPAFSYLYVRSTLQQSFKLKRSDWLLFLPALLTVLNHLPYHLQPPDVKYQYMQTVAANPKLITIEAEGFLPAYAAIILRLVVCWLFLVGQWYWLLQYKPVLLGGAGLQQNKATYQWLKHFTIVLTLFIASMTFTFGMQFTTRPDFNHALVLTICGTVVYISIYLLVQPAILYGLTGWIQPAERQPMASDAVEEEKQNRSISLSREQADAIKGKLEAYINEQYPFRKPGYKIQDLSTAIGVPAYLVSALLNQEYGKNFNEFLNERRVEYLLGQRNEHPEKFRQLTLEALSREAGFNSRTTFIAAVKRKTGQTPSVLFGLGNN